MSRATQILSRMSEARGSRIARIHGVTTRHYGDTGQTQMHVDWEDEKGRRDTTSGDPNNAHMQALAARGAREGVPHRRDDW